MTELEVYKYFFECCFDFSVNLNDVFYYACGDCEKIETDDLEHLIPVIQKYGFDALIAYSAIKRQHDPTIPKRITENYKKAKSELQHLADVGEILFEEFWNKEQARKENNLYDGQAINWSSLTRFPRMLNKEPKVSVIIFQVARLPDGTFAIGGSYHDAKTRLLRKYTNKKKRLNKS